MIPVPRLDRWILAGFAALAVLGCLVLLRVSGIYVSPDETANAFFAHEFARRWALPVFEPLNVEFADALHPRSVVSVGGYLLPGSFVGLPVLYGTVGSFFGGWTMAFLTPFLATAAVFAWHRVISKVFDREIGLLSAIFLAVHPAWWYYSARSFMHNVPFAAFLIFAAYFLVVRPAAAQWKRPWADAGLAGACVAVALSLRTSEAAWMALAALAAGAFFWKRRSWKSIAAFFAGLLLALLPFVAVTQSTYGHPLSTGYTVTSQPKNETSATPSLPSPSSTDSTTQRPGDSTNAFLSFLFPFSVSGHDIRLNVLAYGLGLFWWMSVLSVVGLPLAFSFRSVPRELRRARVAYAVAAAIVVLYLAVLYGSWTFADNPDATRVTIGNSHVRYWIPAFVLTTPFAAFAVRWVARRPFTSAARRIALAAVVLACVGLSVRATFFASEDAVVPTAAKLAQSREDRSRLLALTQPSAVVIVDRADKLFFPARRVLYPLREERTYALMPRLLLRAPLYYYGITLPQADMDYLNREKLGEMGLGIEAVEEFGIETLYRIRRIEN